MTQSYTGGEGYDPTMDAVDIVAGKTREAIDEFNQREQARLQANQQNLEVEEQARSEQDDPRNADTWGAKALIKEGQSIL